MPYAYFLVICDWFKHDHVQPSSGHGAYYSMLHETKQGPPCKYLELGRALAMATCAPKAVRLLTIPVATSDCSKNSHPLKNFHPPKPLLVTLPEEEGKYPLVLLLHGFALQNSFYTQLMSDISSHGFVVIAPQMYTITGADASLEIKEAAALVNWIAQGLEGILADKGLFQVKLDFEKFALAGHSRGGKVAFGLGLGFASMELKAGAVVGLDPVDGTSSSEQTEPKILKFSKDSLNLGCPALIVGAGLGCMKRNIFFPPCAPAGVSHREFFNDCCKPAFHFVAKECGHMDFLDDRTSGVRGKLTYLVCKNGGSRGPLRSFAGALVAAFLQAVFLGDKQAFEDYLKLPCTAIVALEPPQSYGSLT